MRFRRELRFGITILFLSITSANFRIAIKLDFSPLFNSAAARLLYCFNARLSYALLSRLSQ